MVGAVFGPRSIYLVLFALIAWVAGSFANGWHERAVKHIVCAEHGEVVEVGRSGADSAKYVATLGDAESGEHHDGCSLSDVFPPGALASLPSFDPPFFGVVAYNALSAADARVSGPLLYAPKTSPPRV